MEVTSTSKYVRMSPEKARDLARKVQGLSVTDALRITEFSERKGAFYLGKTLKSAIANAENNARLAVDDLRVKEAVVDEAARIKRSWPRARGSASPIIKRTCHIKVVLTDGKDTE